MNDLRSSISKEAGAIICLISEVCQEKLEAISDKLMNKDALIKLISNANKILSEVGHQCVCSLIENVKSPKFIPKIFEEISSKSSTLRSKLSFYLDLILKNYPSNILEKNISILEPMIEKLVCDANKETRTYARQAFLEYQAMFPNKAQKLYMKFDNPTQKALNDDKNSPALRKNNEVLKEPIKEKPKINLLSTQSHKKEEEPYDQSNDNLSKTVGFAPKLQSKTPEKLSESKKTNTNRTANSSSGVNGDDDTSLYNREIELEDTDDYYNTKTMKSDKTLEKKSHGLPIPLSKKVTGQVNSSTNAKSNKTYKELNEKKSKDEEFTEELTEQKKGISSHEIKKKILTNLNDKQKNDSIHNNNNINNDYNSNNNEQEYYDQKQITKEKYGSNNIITTYNTDQNNKHNEEENYEEKQYYQQQKYGKPESKTLYQNNEMILEKTDKILKNNIKKEESKTNSDDKEDILLIKEEEFDLILEKTENTVFNQN